MAQSPFALRCKIRPLCKVQCERSGKSGPNLWSMNLSPSHPLRPLSTVQKLKVLLPNQLMSCPLKALQNLSLCTHTCHYIFLNCHQSLPNLLIAEIVHMPGRSYQCPTDSCRILVILAESGAFQRNENWQGALPIVSFLLFLVPAESLHSGVHTGMFPGIHQNGMQPE